MSKHLLANLKMDTNRYIKISKLPRWEYSAPSIRAFIPVPTENDYLNGYIRRYFVQKINDKSAAIYEVSDIEYGRVLTKPMYEGVSIKWRISGPLSEQLTNSVIDKGVRESNRISISLVNDKIPNLKFYLPNLLQFYK
jgi:hypothetical protein